MQKKVKTFVNGQTSLFVVDHEELTAHLTFSESNVETENIVLKLKRIVFSTLKKQKKVNVTIIINGGGGDIDVARRIAKELKRIIKAQCCSLLHVDVLIGWLASAGIYYLPLAKTTNFYYASHAAKCGDNIVYDAHTDYDPLMELVNQNQSKEECYWVWIADSVEDAAEFIANPDGHYDAIALKGDPDGSSLLLKCFQLRKLEEEYSEFVEARTEYLENKDSQPALMEHMYDELMDTLYVLAFLAISPNCTQRLYKDIFRALKRDLDADDITKIPGRALIAWVKKQASRQRYIPTTDNLRLGRFFASIINMVREQEI